MNNLGQRFTTVAQCEAYLFSLRGGEKRSEPLSVMHTLLAAFHHPQQRVPFIHVAGTNGKGSTVNFMRELLQQANVRVGAFTSPHLERMNERLTINGRPIADAQLVRYVNELFDVVEREQVTPNFFECMTVIAWRYFADEQVDVALMEVGIGGRIDSTNVATPLVSVITSIGFDHVDMLGHTLAAITAEKAGIIKPSVPVVSAVTQQEARALIAQVAAQHESPYYAFGEQFTFTPSLTDAKHGIFTALNRRVSFTLAMLGAHQQRNAAAAIQAVLLLPNVTLTDAHIEAAMQRAMWAGRFEQMLPNVFIDGAHNEQGTAALINALQQALPTKRYHFIYAAMHDKDHAKSIVQMDAVAHAMMFTTIALPRAATAEALAAQSTHTHKSIAHDWQRPIEQFIDTCTTEDVLIVTGSLYFISEARPFIQTLGEQLHGNSRLSTL